MSFEFNIEKENDVLIVRLIGTLISKPQVQGLLDEIDFQFNEGLKKVIIDLSEMKYMNSTGLNILINILTQSRNKGGEVIIANVPEKINNLLIITKLNNVFNIVKDINAAKEII